jgi:hypothetical protein
MGTLKSDETCVTNTTAFLLSWSGLQDDNTPMDVQLHAVVRRVRDARVSGSVDDDVIPTVSLPPQRGNRGSASLEQLASLSTTVSPATVMTRLRSLPSGALLVACVRSTNGASLSSDWLCTPPTLVVTDSGQWTALSTTSLACVPEQTVST